MPTTTEQIQMKRRNLKDNKDKLEQLRIERGQLAIENSTKHKTAIARLDEQIESVRKDIENAPVELRLLQENLTAEQDKVAQEQRDELLNQQKKVAENVEQLSKQFIEALSKANDVNQQLHAALSAESGIRKKTGQVFLEQYCHGSQQSLSVLLETMQAQMEGQHTQLVGTGMFGSNVPIRL